jgi:hypothetical protein
MIDEGDGGAIGGMKIGRGNRSMQPYGIEVLFVHSDFGSHPLIRIKHRISFNLSDDLCCYLMMSHTPGCFTCRILKIVSA